MKICSFHTKIMRINVLGTFAATVISGNSEQLPNVTIETEKGNIIIELYPDAAPATVANFARLIESGFYDGVTFHRHVPDFVIQGGDPRGTGSGGPDGQSQVNFKIPTFATRCRRMKKVSLRWHGHRTPTQPEVSFISVSLRIRDMLDI